MTILRVGVVQEATGSTLRRNANPAVVVRFESDGELVLDDGGSIRLGRPVAVSFGRVVIGGKSLVEVASTSAASAFALVAAMRLLLQGIAASFCLKAR